MAFAFESVLVEWRGPAPHHFLALPAELHEELQDAAQEVSYGWGMVPVRAQVGGSEWETSLWPRAGGYLLPVQARVRRAEGLELGDVVAVRLAVAPRAGRRANGRGPTG
jgi:hypothetical protein